jgi:hypothetical protein
MGLIKNEFFCPECRKYFVFQLSDSFNLNYRIHCPECGHKHYRKIEDGQITEIRIMDNLEGALVADIFPMKSSCKDFGSESDRDSYYYHHAGEGFLHRSWKECKGHLV